MELMSDSEKEIMKLIWDHGGAMTISELLDQIERTGHDWKRTTVRTFISRLIDKGMLISQKEGRGARYVARISEEEYLKTQSVQFVNQVFGGNVSTLLTSLFGQQCLESKDIEELEKFWVQGKEKLK
ncbi:BlaI/MecI/CopY family transcriptional regulator [Holdemania filiformis]|uniref:BlaI/MecI/CopY family transcriptional regulator n=1 Tax=Holdemania filiformis TaxID=61171 RepID=A0A412G6R7_9FIRM|nr:BlaI/MecI/CopY family transcriptional regulator [Holdemania filiformis]MBS5000335.1 BlaI/MecI/CopY family transcriptional regulator [Holdemania filiformis]RGR76936.1 BlaI/MecI/CopY family transcriptional regulator [Holdemania filiformis]